MADPDSAENELNPLWQSAAPGNLVDGIQDMVVEPCNLELKI